MKPQTLGTRLAQKRREKAAREQRDITQVDVAKAAGVSKTAVSRYESDTDNPRDPTLAKIAAFLDTTLAFLRYGVTETSGQGEAEQPLMTFRIPDEMAETFSRARRDAAPPAPVVETPPEPPKKRAAGDRPVAKRPRGPR